MTPIFFRIDASPKIGLGHLRRCLVLAEACVKAGAVPYFLIRSEHLNLADQAFPEHSVLHSIPWESSAKEDAQITTELCVSHGLQTGVVDHYRVGESGYQEMLIQSGLRWMQFGNLLHKHRLLGTWVHDATPGASAMVYADRVGKPAPHFLAGPEYALVGEEFRQQRSLLTRPVKEEVESVLVTFGGGDDRGGILAALGCLDEAGFQGKRIVLTTRLNPHLAELQKIAAHSTQTELHLDNWHPARLMTRCQLALCAGGTTLHELACLGVPPVIMSIADNQYFPAQAWQEAEMAVNLGPIRDITPKKNIHQLRRLIESPEVRCGMAQRCWQAQDGRGAERVAEIITRK